MTRPDEWPYMMARRLCIAGQMTHEEAAKLASTDPEFIHECKESKPYREPYDKALYIALKVWRPASLEELDGEYAGTRDTFAGED